jgi:hypothetical protein
MLLMFFDRASLPPRPRRSRAWAHALLALVIVLSTRGLSEGLSEGQIHQMHQVDGSRDAVAMFLQSLGIPFKSDTVYVFVIPPMNSARSEGAINPFISHLRKAGVEADIVALAVYNKRRAAEKYLQRRAFTSDYSLVADVGFLESFVFSAGSLRVPFAAKFCVSTGELLTSYSLLGSTNSAVVEWFISDQSKPKAVRPASRSEPSARTAVETCKLVVSRMLRLHDSDEYPLSSSYYVSVNPSGSSLSLRDDLTNYIYIFDMRGGKLVSVMFPDTAEEKTFVDVSPEAYHTLKQFNLVNPMYFSHDFCDDSTLMITASLPRIVMEEDEEDTNFGIYNAPVLIKKNIHDNRALSCVHFQPLPDSTRGRFSHTEASFVREEGLVFVPFSKGWPSGSEMLDERTPLEENPFTVEFYQRNIPQFVVFDFDGRFVGLWGRLSGQLERLRLGYIVGGGLVRFWDGKYYLSDGCSGTICSYDQNATLDDSIVVFGDLPLQYPDVDRVQEPLRYMTETFKLNFKSRVVDFLIARDSYFVLLLDEDRPIFCRLGLSGNGTQRFALPTTYEGKEVEYRLLRDTPSGVVVVSLLESPDETYYCEFQFPGDQ